METSLKRAEDVEEEAYLFGGRVVGVEGLQCLCCPRFTHPPEELQVFLHRQHVKQHVVLRAQTQVLSHLVQVVKNVVAANRRVAAARFQKPCDMTSSRKYQART